MSCGFERIFATILLVALNLGAVASEFRLVVIADARSEVLSAPLGSLRSGGTVALRVPKVGMVRYDFDSKEALAKGKSYFLGLDGVREVYEDRRIRACEVPNDPLWNQQWGAQFIRAPKAWDWTRGLTSIKVAVIDSGITPNHADLTTYEPRWDYVDNDGSPWDGDGHGTHVAGTISAVVNNGVGVAGIGRNCRPYIYRVLDNTGSGYVSDTTAAIVQAVDDGCHVINLSLGSYTPDSAEENACNYAVANGTVVCAAAGNDNTFQPLYPAGYTACIAVGSITIGGSRSSFSNYGSWVDVAAPGTSILSTTMNGGYGYLSGTSMATPHVAGVAALAYSVYDWRSNFLGKRIRGHIQNGCKPVLDGWCQFGTVDAYAAVTRMQSLHTGIGGSYASQNITHARDVVVDVRDNTWFGTGTETLNDFAHRIFVTKYNNSERLWTYTSDYSPNVQANDIQPDGSGGAFLAGQFDGKFAVWHIKSNGTLGQLHTLAGAAQPLSEASSLAVANGKAFAVGRVWVNNSERRAQLAVMDANSIVAQRPLSNEEEEGLQVLWSQSDQSVDVLARSWPAGQPRSLTHYRVRASDLSVLNSSRYTHPGAQVDASQMVRQKNRLLVAASAWPGQQDGSAGIVQFNRLGQTNPAYQAISQGFSGDQVDSFVIANDPNQGLVFSCPKINALLSTTECYVARLNPDLSFSAEWQADTLGGVGYRLLRGFAFGDTRATGVNVTSTGEVWVTGSGYDDTLPGLVAIAWRITSGGDQIGMFDNYGFYGGEYTSATLHPRGYLLAANWTKTGYAPSTFQGFYASHRGARPADPD